MTRIHRGESSRSSPVANEAPGLFDLRALSRRIRRHQGLFVLAVVAGLSVAMALTVHQPVVYTTRAKFALTLNRSFSEFLGSQGRWPLQGVLAFEYPRTSSNRSSEVMYSVFLGRSFLTWALRRHYPEAAIPESLTSRIQNRLVASFPEVSPVLEVRYKTAHPQEGPRLLHQLLEAFPHYLNRRLRSFIQSTRNASRELLGRRDFDDRRQQRLTRRLQNDISFLLKDQDNKAYVSISVLEEPTVSRKGRAWIVNGFIGTGVGILLGFLLVTVAERLDPLLRSSDDIREKIRPRLITTLPEVSLEPGVRMDILGHPVTDFAESIRVLRSHLKVQLNDQPERTLLITSPTRGEGKTTVAFNLARALVLDGEETLLVDADLRGGNVHEMLDRNRSPGLTSILRQGVSLDEAIAASSGLDILTTGKRPSNPTKMLASQPFHELFGELTDRYDWIIVDGTPALGLADTLEVSHRVEHLLLVLRAKISDMRPTREALQDLREADATPMGVVLNAVSTEDPTRSTVSWDSGSIAG